MEIVLSDVWWLLAFLGGFAIGMVLMVAWSNRVWRRASERETERVHQYARR